MLDASDQCCCHGTECCHGQDAPNLGFIVMPMWGTTVTIRGEREHTNRVQRASNVDAATLRQAVSCSEAALGKTQVIYLMGLFVIRFVAVECDEDT